MPRHESNDTALVLCNRSGELCTQDESSVQAHKAICEMRWSSRN